MVIQHNILAINAQRQYGMAARKMSSDTAKLSSGYRVNKSADDATGLSISEKMRRQIRGLTRGVQNTEEGISLCQVADGALNEVHDMVHRLNVLSVQAANGTNERSDREKLQDEVDQLLAEINRISDTTAFNGHNLFGGASVGEIAQFDSSKGIISASEAVAKYIIEAGNAERYINTEGADEAVVKVITEAKSNAAAIDVEGHAAAIADTGVQCGDFTVYGGTEGSDFTYDGQTGVLTIATGTPLTIQNNLTSAADLGNIDITGVPNANITLKGDYKIAMFQQMSVSDGAKLTMASGSSLTLGRRAGLTMEKGAKLTMSTGSILTMESGAKLTLDAGGIEGNANGQGTGVVMEGNAKIYIGDNASMLLFDASYLWIKDIDGRVQMETSAGIYGANKGTVYTPSRNKTIRGGSRGVTIQSLGEGDDPFPGSQPTEDSAVPESSASTRQTIPAYAYGKRRLMKKWWIQSGNEAHDGMYVDIDTMNIKTLGLLGLDVTTQQNADKAINTIDGALAYVSKMRSKIGAQQNRLEHIVLNENNIVENTTASESRIRDLDMAEGMAAYSISNIFVRAGETMLAQANTSNAGVMALLR